MPAPDPQSLATPQSLASPKPSGDRVRTLGATVRAIAARLRDAGLDSPELDARLMVEAVTGMSREALIATPDHPIPASQLERLAGYVDRRLDHEPVSRILGRREFWGREFEISPDTLDPRPDSETLIAAALELCAEDHIADRPLRILDIGTGTGCLLLTLLAELPTATGIGVDISPAALDIARRNAIRRGLDRRATWVEGDALIWPSGGTGGTGECAPVGQFDLIVCNPPYIPTREIACLDLEVRTFDPYVALNGGDDGLDFYRGIIYRLRQLHETGWVVLEIGAGQLGDVTEIITSLIGHDLIARSIREFRDLGGHTRCVAWKTR